VVEKEALREKEAEIPDETQHDINNMANPHAGWLSATAPPAT